MALLCTPLGGKADHNKKNCNTRKTSNLPDVYEQRSSYLKGHIGLRNSMYFLSRLNENRQQRRKLITVAFVLKIDLGPFFLSQQSS